MENERIAEMLYDHYKESFSIIRRAEIIRDRRFLFVVVLLGFIVLQATFAITFAAVVEKVNILGFTVELTRLPTPVILSATWLFLFIVVVRYYQSTMHIERLYSYLHTQEDRLSHLLPDGFTIERESSGYMTEKGKWFRYWVWLFYTAVYPLVLLVLSLWSIVLELNATGIGSAYKVFDTILAILTGLTVILYVIGTWLNK